MGSSWVKGRRIASPSASLYDQGLDAAVVAPIHRRRCLDEGISCATRPGVLVCQLIEIRSIGCPFLSSAATLPRVNDRTDQHLLRDYAEHRSEAAFDELVRRHVDLVHSAALRMVRDAHLAQDVTQGTFLALARSAPELADRVVITGWLHRTAQNIAAQTVRTDVRRRAREQEAAAMNELLSAEHDATWEQVAPHLDAALGELSESDRDALLCRYFQRQSAREMAQTLGISDEAAQRRVSRAVERLRDCFARRGVTVGASGLVVAVSASAVQAAPVELASAISNNAVLQGLTFGTTTTATLTKAITMILTRKTLIAVTVVLLSGAATAVVTSQMKARTSGAGVVVNLEDYVGRFEMPDRRIDILKKGSGISVFIDGKPAFVAYPEAMERFVSRDHGSITELTFVKNAEGRPVQFTLVRDGRKLGELKRPDAF